MNHLLHAKKATTRRPRGGGGSAPGRGSPAATEIWDDSGGR